MAKTSVMVAWSFEMYSYFQLTVPQVSDSFPLGLLITLRKLDCWVIYFYYCTKTEKLPFFVDTFRPCGI